MIRRAWKFLASGAVGPFSGFAWPRPEGDGPGAWIAVEPPFVPCARGIHACRDEDLAFWIGEELWRIELGGEVVESRDGLVAERARLIARHEGLAEDLAALARAASERALALGGHAAVAPVGAASRALSDAGNAPGSAYLACVAAGLAADPSGADAAARLAAFRAERAWQSAFLAARLPP